MIITYQYTVYHNVYHIPVYCVSQCDNHIPVYSWSYTGYDTVRWYSIWYTGYDVANKRFPVWFVLGWLDELHFLVE